MIYRSLAASGYPVMAYLPILVAVRSLPSDSVAVHNDAFIVTISLPSDRVLAMKKQVLFGIYVSFLTLFIAGIPAKATADYGNTYDPELSQLAFWSQSGYQGKPHRYRYRYKHYRRHGNVFPGFRFKPYNGYGYPVIRYWGDPYLRHGYRSHPRKHRHYWKKRRHGYGQGYW